MLRRAAELVSELKDSALGPELFGGAFASLDVHANAAHGCHARPDRRGKRHAGRNSRVIEGGADSAASTPATAAPSVTAEFAWGDRVGGSTSAATTPASA